MISTTGRKLFNLILASRNINTTLAYNSSCGYFENRDKAIQEINSVKEHSEMERDVCKVGRHR